MFEAEEIHEHVSHLMTIHITKTKVLKEIIQEIPLISVQVALRDSIRRENEIWDSLKTMFTTPSTHNEKTYL